MKAGKTTVRFSRARRQLGRFSAPAGENSSSAGGGVDQKGRFGSESAADRSRKRKGISVDVLSFGSRIRGRTKGEMLHDIDKRKPQADTTVHSSETMGRVETVGRGKATLKFGGKTGGITISSRIAASKKAGKLPPPTRSAAATLAMSAFAEEAELEAAVDDQDYPSSSSPLLLPPTSSTAVVRGGHASPDVIQTAPGEAPAVTTVGKDGRTRRVFKDTVRNNPGKLVGKILRQGFDCAIDNVPSRRKTSADLEARSVRGPRALFVGDDLSLGMDLPSSDDMRLAVRRWPGNALYEGEIWQGLRHGLGAFTSNVGNQYIGQFYNDERHGLGVSLHALGERYEGSFKNDERHGFGIFFFGNGATFAGVWSEDRAVAGELKQAADHWGEEPHDRQLGCMDGLTGGMQDVPDIRSFREVQNQTYCERVADEVFRVRSAVWNVWRRSCEAQRRANEARYGAVNALVGEQTGHIKAREEAYRRAHQREIDDERHFQMMMADVEHSKHIAEEQIMAVNNSLDVMRGKVARARAEVAKAQHWQNVVKHREKKIARLRSKLESLRLKLTEENRRSERARRANPDAPPPPKFPHSVKPIPGI